MKHENPDQIDARLWQNDRDRDLTEWRTPNNGGCGRGCLGGLFDLIFWGFILVMALYVLIYTLFNG